MTLGENNIKSSLRRSDWSLYLYLVTRARVVLSRFEFHAAMLLIRVLVLCAFSILVRGSR